MPNSIRVKLTPFPLPVPGLSNAFRGIQVRLSRDGEGTTLAEKGSKKPAAIEFHAVFIDTLFPFQSRAPEKFATINGEVELVGSPARPSFTASKDGSSVAPVDYVDPPSPEIRDANRSTPRRKSVELQFDSATFEEMGDSSGPLSHLILPEFPEGARYLEIDTVLLVDGQTEAALELSDLFDVLIHRNTGDPVPPTTFGMRLESERPLPSPIPFRVTDPDGGTHEGELNENGECFVDNLTVGDCQLELPSLAAVDWDATPKEAASTSHTASGEEDMPKIACDQGFQDWRTIFEDDENDALREQRPNPDQLAKDDAVTIPGKDAEPEIKRTGQLHVFALAPEPVEKLRLRIDSDVGFTYELEVAGQMFRGTKSAGAIIEHQIPRDATSGTLAVLHEGDSEEEERRFELKIGALEPVETDRGVQARLTNLGFDTQGVDGKIGTKTKSALERFQRFAGLEVTGEADDGTRQELETRHDEEGASESETAAASAESSESAAAV